MQEALLNAHEDEEPVFKLFEAAVSVPIRFKSTSGTDERCLIALRFSESVFATSSSVAADSFWKFAEKVRLAPTKPKNNNK